MTVTKSTMLAICALLAAGVVQAAGDVSKGSALAYNCINCHKADGKGDFETPAIAGLEEAYLLAQLRSFHSGRKESLDDMMHTYTEDLSDEDLQDLAAYWASLEK